MEILNNKESYKNSNDLEVRLAQFLKGKEILQQKIWSNFLKEFKKAYSKQDFFDIFDSLTGGVTINDVDWNLGEEGLIKFLGRKK